MYRRRPGEEACKYERVKQKMNKIQEEGSFLHMGNIPFFFYVYILEVYGIETCAMSYNELNMD